MKNCISTLAMLAMASLALPTLAAEVSGQLKAGDDNSWTTKVSVKRGEEHTFWVKPDTGDTGVSWLSVEGSYTYTEDGERYEESIWPSESSDVQNTSGSSDYYVLLTAEDWEWVPSRITTVSFKVTVEGFYDEDNKANNKFKFGHESGRANFPREPEPIEVIPEGSTFARPKSVTMKELAAGQSVAGNASKVTCLPDAEAGGTYYIKTSSLTAGHRYFFGVEGADDIAILTSGGTDVSEECVKPYDGWARCDAAYSFVVPEGGTGAYVLAIACSPGNEFSFYHVAQQYRAPDKHDFTDLPVGTASEPFEPGYLNDPDTGAYDPTIDQKLFRVTGYKKGDCILFGTDGADSGLLMRLYDAKGNILAENTRGGDSVSDVTVAWTATAAYSASAAVYLGVCQQLEEGEEPSAGPVTVAAVVVSPENGQTPLSVVPDGVDRSPVNATDVEPSEERTLSATEWVNTFVIAARAGITYRVKAVCGDADGLTLDATVYTLSGKSKRKIEPLGSLDPAAPGWMEFTPTAHGNVYIDVSVANAKGDYGYNTAIGSCAGLSYGPYSLCASAAGASLGILTAPMKGAPQDLMGWKILSGPGITATKEVFYAAGTSAILAAGDYRLVANAVNGFAKPDAKGYATVTVAAGTQPTVAAEYKYTDTADPLDDSPDTKAKHPTLGKAYSPTKLAPSATKPAEATRSLWDDDPADWYAISATAGSYYRFSLSGKEGAPKMAVYGPDGWTDECSYATFTDPEDTLQVFAEKKGTYYVKVSHLDEAAPEDSAYTLKATMANPGLVKFAKTDVSAKDNVAYVDLSVSRSSKDGIVRVKYRTEGAQSDKDDAYYYPTNGVIAWAAGDSKAQIVRVRLVPNEGWTTNKIVKVVLEPFAADDESFDRDNEYLASFDKDKQGKPLDTATVTITASAKKVPGTIQAVCDAPKKPVFTVTAGETVDIPLERVLGSDGIVGVKVETAKGSANKSGETDFTPVTDTLVWNDGDDGVKTVSVTTKAIDGDYTAVKTFTLKLAALTSAKNDAVQYDKPTLASTTVTVNILNDKFAATFDDYSKTVTAGTDGYTVKEGKKGAWVVAADGTFNAPNKGDLTFTFSTTGKFKYIVDGGEEQTFVATSSSKTLTVKGKTTFKIVGYELDGEPVALRQGVKYEESFGVATTLKASNLPTGLKLEQDKSTKEWRISGVPSKAGLFQAMVGTSAICYTVAAQGTSAGTFTGLATTYDTTNGVPTLASVTLTAALGGKLSAKISIAGKTYTFADAGYSYATGDPDDPEAPAYVTAELPLVQKIGSGKTAQTVTNWLYYTVMDVPEDDSEGWNAEAEIEIQMTALPDAKGSGFQEDAWYVGKACRDNSKSAKAGKEAWESAMAAWAGYYTVSLVAPGALPGEPRGSGYMTMTLDAKGKAKLAGMLADGTAYSGSATAALFDDGEGIRVPLYAQKGSWVFGGWLSIRKDADGNPVATIDSLDDGIVWKNDDPASTRDGYEGFALYLQPAGGWYDTVSNLQRSYLESDLSIDLPEGEDALAEIMDALALAGDYAFAAQPSGQAVDVLGNALSVQKQVLVKDASKLIDWEASANASNVKLTFKRATGIVSGTFDLWYEGTNAKGVLEQKSITGLKHYGVLVPLRGDDGSLEDDVLSSGFFLAQQTLNDEVTTTVGGKTTTKKVSRKWNGSYRFDIKAVPAERTWTDYVEE